MSERTPGGPRRRRMLRGSEPTEPLPMADLLRRTPYQDTAIPGEAAEDAAVRQGVDLAARVGELMLRSGAGAPQVQGSVAAVAAAAGVDVIEVDITLQSLLIQATSSEGRQHTLLRVVRRSRYDYARLVAVHELVGDLVAGRVAVEEAAVRLRAVKRHPRAFSQWVVSAASALLASAVAVMAGATLLAAVVTVLVVLAVTGVDRLHQRIALPEFYGNAINSFAATVLAGGVYALGASDVLPFGADDFAFVVAGGIVTMLPGRTMAAAIEDVLFGFPLTGAGRLLGVVVSLSGLVIGIATGLGLMLTVTERLDSAFVPPSVLDLEVTGAPLAAAVLGAVVVGAAGAVTLQSRWRLVLPVAGLSVLAAGISAGLTRADLVGPVLASGVAAVVLGVCGGAVAQRLDVPSTVLVVPASYALLPGLTIFLGLYELVARGEDQGLLSFQAGSVRLLGAFGVLLAIATGSSLGEVLASSWSRRNRSGATDAPRRAA
ncbi:MAG: threonine/serine ThrE exporter family protein [Dermatophilaceae bacterium]